MDIECDAGCGVIPMRYRDKSFVNALQWAIGLEMFLLVEDWRVPDGRPPQRRAVHDLPAPDPAVDGQELPQRHAAEDQPGRRRREHVGSLDREYSLYEIAIMPGRARAQPRG